MIHTVLRHDKIVDNHDPDFALVEIEAQKIADEAIRALKASRKYCKPAESGIPNMVGVKFGGRLKIPTSGGRSSNGEKEGGGAQSSRSLLDRIRLRSQGIQVSGGSGGGEKTSSPDVNSSSSNKSDDNVDKDEDELIKDEEANPIDRTVRMSRMIQKYMTRISRRYNRASTEQIVDYFKDRLSKTDSVKFKAVLKTLCEFDKSTRVWSLRDEYLE